MKWIMESNRFQLRELTVDDAIHFYHLNADPEILKFTGDDPFDKVEDAAQFLENYQDYRQNGYGRWAVIRKDNNEFVGWNGLKFNEEKLVDIGFRFYRKHWGKGFATESSQAVLNYGFVQLNLTEIVGRASTNNHASIRVLEKIGMQFWKQSEFEGIENAVYYKINNPNA